MIKLNDSYLGYTDNKTPLQKSRIESALDKNIRSKQDGVIKMKQLIFNLILEGRVSEKEENYQTYKRDGELTKPKTVYRLIQGNIYMDLNKTEYDFANYIIKNGFNDKEKAIEYLTEEAAEIQRLNQLKQEQEEKERQEKIQKEKQEEEFKEWLYSQAEAYPKNEKYNTAKDIFMDEVGNFHNRQIQLLVLIDNFDSPQCREKLSDWLSYYNTASLKTFYYITGIKLGRTDKAIKEKLDAIASKDFTGLIEYKKKPIPEGYKKFYKMIGITGFEEAYGEYIRLKDFDLYLTINGGLYNLTEGRTGVIIAQGHSRDETIERFNKNTDEYNISTIKETIEGLIEKNGLSPIYEVVS